MSRNRPAGRPRATRPRQRGKRGWRGVVLIVLCVAIVLVVGTVEGPVVVRQVWSLVGVRRVEAHAELIRQAAAACGLDPCLIAALMYTESRGDVGAVSDKGALGLFQLMPSAADDAARRLHLPPPTREELLTNAGLNARLGTAHLAWLFRHEGPDPERVLVAYNAGRARLAGWIREEGSYAAWRAARVGRSETLAYAEQVLDFRERFRERGVIVPTPIAPTSTNGPADTDVHGLRDAALDRTVEDTSVGRAASHAADPPP